jgi:hypothetical protein
LIILFTIVYNPELLLYLFYIFLKSSQLQESQFPDNNRLAFYTMLVCASVMYPILSYRILSYRILVMATSYTYTICIYCYTICATFVFNPPSSSHESDNCCIVTLTLTLCTLATLSTNHSVTRPFPFSILIPAYPLTQHFPFTNP